MRIKKFLIIDDEWELRKPGYEVLRLNIEKEVINLWQVEFNYLEKWDDFETIMLDSFDVVVSDVILHNEQNYPEWPKAASIWQVSEKLKNKKIPIFAVSSQWAIDSDETIKRVSKLPVRAMFTWDSIESESESTGYATYVIYKEIFSSYKYHDITPKMTVAILHCSDFHYQNSANSKSEFKLRLDALNMVLKEELEKNSIKRLHFICLSGDFIDKGKLEGYSEFIDIFKEFIQDGNNRFPTPTILTVPGNHDYSKKHATLLSHDKSLFASVFYPYYDFATTLSPDMASILKKPSNLWFLEETASLGFYFYGINTELQNKEDYHTFTEETEHIGKICNEDLQELKKTYRKFMNSEKYKNIVPIGLLHRTIDPRSESNQKNAKGGVASKYITNHQQLENVYSQSLTSPIFLCGDIHASLASKEIGGESHGILSSAPTFMGEPANTLGTGFNLILLSRNDDQVEHIEIKNFTYNSPIEQFEENAPRGRCYKRDKRGVFHQESCKN